MTHLETPLTTIADNLRSRILEMTNGLAAAVRETEDAVRRGITPEHQTFVRDLDRLIERQQRILAGLERDIPRREAELAAAQARVAAASTKHTQIETALAQTRGLIAAETEKVTQVEAA